MRQWLISEGFQGKEGQLIPVMSPEFVNSISERYIELFEKITGEKFVPRTYDNIQNTIEQNVNHYIATI